MFDFQEDKSEPPSLALWERENLWGSCNTVQRNYRTSTIECRDTGDECRSFESECPEFRVPIECQQDYDQLVASIVKDVEDNKIQLGPISTDFVVAPTKILYPKVRWTWCFFSCRLVFTLNI